RKPCQANDLRTAIEIGMYRHQAHRRLRESEQRLAATLKSIGEGIIAVDAKGQVTLLNAVAEQLTGRRTNEAQSQPIETGFPLLAEQPRQPRHNRAGAAVDSGRVTEIPEGSVLINRDGSEVAVEPIASPIALEGEERAVGAVLAFRDVRQKRQT